PTIRSSDLAHIRPTPACRSPTWRATTSSATTASPSATDHLPRRTRTAITGTPVTTSVRTPDLHRVRQPAARVGLRVLRQLHRGVSHRRAYVQVRARPARGRHLGRVESVPDRHDLPVLRRRLQSHPARPGQPDRQGDLARRPRHHTRQPLHQGPLRVPAREPQALTPARAFSAIPDAPVREMITTGQLEDLPAPS